MNAVLALKKIEIFMTTLNRGLFTGLNQDYRMNMTEIGEHDWKIDNDKG